MTRVLVIDDEAPIRLLCRVNLEAEGMTVLEASDGPTGLEQARENTPDVVLLDVMMPGLDGWRVAEQLLQDDRTSEIPIIFLTARAELRARAPGKVLARRRAVDVEGRHAAGEVAVGEVVVSQHVRRVRPRCALKRPIEVERPESVGGAGGVHRGEQVAHGAGGAFRCECS